MRFYDGTELHGFAACCYLIDDGESILYNVWDPDDGEHEKACESDVTTNPPRDLDAAALSMLHEISLTQIKVDVLGNIKHYNVAKPSLN